MRITAYDLAERFVGLKEVPGSADNPQVLAMLKLDGAWPEHDEVPWCSAFANYIAWLLRLPRSKSLAARSWLGIGAPVELGEAVRGFDVVILMRGLTDAGPEVLDAPGHVGFFSSLIGSTVWILAGNQGNRVSVQGFAADRVLGVRRLFEDIG